MHRHADFLERLGVGIEELDTLLVLRLILCRFNSLGPFLPFHLIDQCKAFFKNCPVFLRHFIQECTVANQDIRYHLVHIIGIILADITMAIGGQCHFIVFRAVDNLGLQGGIYLAKAHRSSRAAEEAHHFHVGR